MDKKILSIITNFGCDTGCKYCIWKGHPLSRYRTSVEGMNWKLLKESILEYSKDMISVSGGGDPLFESHRNRHWWNMLFKICEETGTKIELHTSKLRPEWAHNRKLARYVLHTTYEKFEFYEQSIGNFSVRPFKLRLVFVVDETMEWWQVDNIADFCTEHGIELSFRQMVKDGEPCYYLHDYLKEGHKDKWWYIEQSDYNLYFMPDNKIYDTYLGV